MVDLNDWMNSSMPATVKRLEESILKEYHVETGDYFGLSKCTEIIEILDDLQAILFPGCYGKENITIDAITYFLHDKLRHIARRLIEHLKVVFQYQCMKEQKMRCDCDSRAKDVLNIF